MLWFNQSINKLVRIYKAKLIRLSFSLYLFTLKMNLLISGEYIQVFLLSYLKKLCFPLENVKVSCKTKATILKLNKATTKTATKKCIESRSILLVSKLWWFNQIINWHLHILFWLAILLHAASFVHLYHSTLLAVCLAIGEKNIFFFTKWSSDNQAKHSVI